MQKRESSWHKGSGYHKGQDVILMIVCTVEHVHVYEDVVVKGLTYGFDNLNFIK